MSSLSDLTLKEAAQYWGVTEQTIRRWIKTGKIHAELRTGPYGHQYYISASQVQTATEIQDVVRVDRTVDMASLATVMEQYLSQREQAILEAQSLLMESIQRLEQREINLENEVAATRAENESLKELVEQRLNEHDRVLMETLRAIQESKEQQPKRKKWPWSK